MLEKLQKIADAWATVESTSAKAVDALKHPLEALIASANWVARQETLFALTALVGVLLWMFDLPTGKRIIQWSVAIYAVLCVVLSAA